MEHVYIAADNIITSLGFNTDENMVQLKNGHTGLNIINDRKYSPTPIPLSIIDSERLETNFNALSAKSWNIDTNSNFTRFEKLAILSISDALSQTNVDIKSKKTLILLSTTKGNIELIEPEHQKKFDKNRIQLWETAKIISQYFLNPNKSIVVSNACISGVLAIIVGTRLLKTGNYENIIVVGGDLMTEFIIAGFLSFKALSKGPCKPFDIKRDGLSLGEGFGTIILTINEEYIAGNKRIIVQGGSTSNDSNHISGPSRTGDGLYISIKNVLKEAALRSDEIDYISTHGTGTDFNDEMEAKAMNLASLNEVPLNGYKGYWGHTMGAAGIIESIASIYSLENNCLIKSLGFNELGVTKNINVIEKFEEKELTNCLKTASGFGGCNAAAVFTKIDS